MSAALRSSRLAKVLGRLSGLAMAALVLAAPALFGAPPVSNLTGLTVSPAAVDVSAASQTVTITGTDSAATAVKAALALPGVQTTGFIDGTVASGTFQVTLTIPAHAAAGTWQLSLHTTGDGNYNYSQLQGKFPCTVVVTSTAADATAPKVTSFALTPLTLDTTSADQTVDASFAVTDDQSGTSAVGFWLRDPAGHDYAGATVRTGGTALSGTWSGSVTIPKGALPGTYLLLASTQDELGNAKVYSNAELSALGTAAVLNLGKLGQTITFDAIPDHTYGDAPFALSATATSGQPVTFAVLSGPADLAGNLLTITGAGTVTVRASCGAAGDYAAAPDVDRVFLVAKANATIVVTPYSVTYDGNPHTATATAKGVEAVPADLASLLTLSGTTHTSAGDYPSDAWTFAGNENYHAASGTVHDAIAKADAVISVTPYSVTYDGNPHTATATAKGVEAVPADLAGLLTLGGTTHTNAGDYPSDAWSFAGNENYHAASGTVHDAIAKANAAVQVSGYAGTYDGNPHGATGTATGVKGEALAGLNLGASFTDVPGGTATWSFTDATGNYHDQTGSVAITISRANATIVVTPYSVTFDGNPHTAAGTATGVKGENLGSLLALSGTTHTQAGDYPSDAWSFAGNLNYNPASGTVHDAITYAFLGPMSPYSPGRSYKIKSAIPIKWQYANAAGTAVPSSGAAPEIRILKVADYAAADGAILLDDAGASGYQYDALTGTWQFNWKTTGLTPGTYYIYITSGTTKQVNGPFPVQLTN